MSIEQSRNEFTDKNNMKDCENDFSFIVDGRINDKNNEIIIYDKKQQDQLRNKGFGQYLEKKYFLYPYEALYLLYTKRMNLKKKITIYSFMN
ncbi:MAG: hypothetical protein ACPKQO_03170 [Nitrososphaeraceae archaeon]